MILVEFDEKQELISGMARLTRFLCLILQRFSENASFKKHSDYRAR